MREFGKLPLIERAMACRSRAEELVEELQRASPETAEELRRLSRQWLLLAQHLEDSAAARSQNGIQN